MRYGRDGRRRRHHPDGPGHEPGGPGGHERHGSGGGRGFDGHGGFGGHRGRGRAQRGDVRAATLILLAEPAEDGLLSWFEANVEPLLAGAGSPLVALLVADPSPNSFPRLPV
ncbi:MAG: hypothetical protein QOF39_2192, partial [Frankiales bacterium]|nr:hypothetical protein [Frankiales bacterium]